MIGEIWRLVVFVSPRLVWLFVLFFLALIWSPVNEERLVTSVDRSRSMDGRAVPWLPYHHRRLAASSEASRAGWLRRWSLAHFANKRGCRRRLPFACSAAFSIVFGLTCVPPQRGKLACFMASCMPTVIRNCYTIYYYMYLICCIHACLVSVRRCIQFYWSCMVFKLTVYGMQSALYIWYIFFICLQLARVVDFSVFFFLKLNYSEL